MTSPKKAYTPDGTEQLRKFTFFGVALSTSAVLTAVVVIPLIYSYVQFVQASLQEEVDFCFSKTNALWDEYILLHAATPNTTKRLKRYAYRSSSGSSGSYFGRSHGQYRAVAAGDSFYQPAAAAIESSGMYSSCSCGVGGAGPPGTPGDDGLPGLDGKPGNDGRNGPDAMPGQRPSEDDYCFNCPPAPAGRPGPPGFPGEPGTPGRPGFDGGEGRPGPPGLPGPVGPPGPQGLDGSSGLPGRDGQLLPGPPAPPGSDGAPGPPGLPGSDGLPGVPGTSMPGPPGRPGERGRPGAPGQPGRPGNQGRPGPPGNSNGCDHCPTPRTPPGY